MDIVEIDNFDLESELHHWWIKTRFLYIKKSLDISLKNKNDIKVLEVGCGTGQNLSYIRNQYPQSNKVSKLYGVDINLPKDFKRNDLSNDDYLGVETPEGETFDVLVMMDVIEHVESPTDLIKDYIKFLKDDGIVLITVPAFNHLWSNHDKLLGHYKRYDLETLCKEAHICSLEKLFNRYIFSPFYLPVLIIRKLISSESDQTDLTLPNPILNNILYFIGIIEFLIYPIRLPFGTSAVGIFRKAKA